MRSLGFRHFSALSASPLGNLTPDREHLKFPNGVICWRQSKSVILVLVSFDYWASRIEKCLFWMGMYFDYDPLVGLAGLFGLVDQKLAHGV